MNVLDLTLHFHAPGYCGNPYWPEMAKLIDIQKQSGMNRARSEANRRRALEQHLKASGMSFDEYTELERAARRSFHTNSDGFIILPETRILACMVNACLVAPAAMRPCNAESLRSLIKATDFVTDRKEADGVYRRFATVTSGTGAKLSNQRGLREDEYISNFDARGSVSHDPSHVKPDTLIAFLRYAGREVGIGASRKMGFGRFDVDVSG